MENKTGPKTELCGTPEEMATVTVLIEAALFWWYEAQPWRSSSLQCDYSSVYLKN